MKRSKHSLSYYKLATMDMGKLYPVACFEVLPGDTVQQATSALIRVSPLVAPVMHPVTVRMHHWFVPNRLVWDGWEEFITGGPDGLGGTSGAYPVLPGTVAVAKSLLDYMGVPPGTNLGLLSALPVYAYNRIFNEFYRDEDLVSERADDDLSVAAIAWEKDRFTAARPWPQKGPDVSLPLGVSAPVVPNAPGDGPSFFLADASGTARTLISAQQGTSTVGTSGPVAGQVGTMSWADPKLRADLTNASAVNVNDVRRAFALQRYAEARALYGSRYTEYLRYLGVRSSDARLQRPEYLGGGKQTISFTEVLQTGPGGTPGSPVPPGVGQLAGHGIAAMRSRRYRRFFEEHGHVLSLMSVRPRTMYADGVEKMWTRRTKEDYWQKELELIGQQEILNKEIYALHAAPDGVFGYGDQYAEYRHIQSKISGEFRSTLNYWHMARQFAAAPVLNASFVQCDPTKRIHQVATNDVLWVMASNSIQARRMVRRAGSTGRII